MMTLSTYCVPSRSTDRALSFVCHNRHIRLFILTVVAFLFFCVGQISFAKPFHVTQAESGLGNGGLGNWQSLPTEFSETEFSETELSETELSGNGQPEVWCNSVRLQDEIIIINSRSVGSCCDPEVLRGCLRCERYIASGGSCGQWHGTDLIETLSTYNPTIPTVVYVHGNRISACKAKQRCLKVYRKLVCCADSNQPIRFIAFSWPSAQIPGPLRDARVKAARTRPAGCQLAWVLDQIPGDVPVGLIGYSLGARVTTGALHILGGGHLNGMGLTERANPNRQPVRLVMIAAATHAHWLGQGQHHGQALSQVDQALSINNSSDIAMQWYHLSAPNSKPQAMGLCGPTCLGPERHKVRVRNAARSVGSSHDLHRYLSSPGTACQLWKIAAWGE